MRKVISWDEYNMNSAVQTSERSKDPHTQVGAYICDENNSPVSRGYNGFPRGIEDSPERWERPTKYLYVVHAETNAILNAQRSVKGCKLYVTLHPCSRCALMVVAAGIKEVFVQNVRDDEDTKLSKEILLESGIITHIREFV